MSDDARTRAQSGVTGSQTLMRGLDVIEAVAEGMTNLPDLSARVGLSRSTAHRLASSLVERGYLAFEPRAGYRLASKVLELGHLAQVQTNLLQVAQPHLEALALATADTVHLGVLEGDQALYLGKVPGHRRIMISSRVGERQPLTSTGLGKALILDHSADYWRTRFAIEQASVTARAQFEIWVARMRDYVAAGRAFDLEENEDQIRCVAAPIRDASARIVAAISVSSAAQYMSDQRMRDLSADVVGTAAAISHELGWRNPKRGE